MQNFPNWSLLDMKLSAIMIGGWGKGAASLRGRKKKTASNGPPQDMLSHHLHLPTSQYMSLPLEH